jgi:pimeloyl-ACP methyl ester carboxylesterase
MILLFVLVTYVSTTVAQSTDFPVVFIPGILGSRLADENGKPVWEGHRYLYRLPRLEYPLDPTENKIQVVGLLKKALILGRLGSGVYQGILNTLEDFGFKNDKNLFIFPYDWRKSNFETATILSEFINSKKALRGKRFNILAHSMGGLIALIYAHKFNDDGRLNRVITLGTPYFGSLEALRTLLYEKFKFRAVSGIDRYRVNRIILSFPSLYELLPNYKCCEILDSSKQVQETVDILDISSWEKFGWLPAEFTRQGPLRARILNSLDNGRRVAQLSRKAIPNGVSWFRIVGIMYETKEKVFFRGYPEDYHWYSGPGDGTVWQGSASAGSLQDAFRFYTPEKHITIFNDTSIRSKLHEFLLKEEVAGPEKQPRPPEVYVGETDKKVPLRGITMDLGDPLKVMKERVSVEIGLFSEPDKPIAGVQLTGDIIEAEKNTSVDSLKFEMHKDLRYRALFDVPIVTDVPRTYEIQVSVPNVGKFREVFFVFEKL